VYIEDVQHVLRRPLTHHGVSRHEDLVAEWSTLVAIWIRAVVVAAGSRAGNRLADLGGHDTWVEALGTEGRNCGTAPSNCVAGRSSGALVAEVDCGVVDIHGRWCPACVGEAVGVGAAGHVLVAISAACSGKASIDARYRAQDASRRVGADTAAVDAFATRKDG